MRGRSEAGRERLALFGSVALAVFVAIAGFWLSRMFCDPHWMNRAGAAIVAMQVVAVAVEVSWRRRLDRLAREVLGVSKAASRKSADQDINTAEASLERFLHNEIAKSERQAFIVAAFLTVVGELLHGFGDLLLAFLP